MISITSSSSRAWLDKHPLAVDRYLRRNHNVFDRPLVYKLLYYDFPDEGVKLVQNFSLPDEDKKLLLIKFLVESPQIICGIFADQRQGKDGTVCKIFDDCIKYCESVGIIPPRIVTLMNMRCPPFVNSEDMFFSFKSIPSGTKEQEVWIYCSEIETVLPARDGASPENKLFSQLEGTMAQNHQKLFGCSKLASKVDINFIRGMNCKIFKYISSEKLKVEGVERENLLSPLAKWHLPNNPLNKKQTLLSFDNQTLTCSYDLPDWWSSSYSEQFNNIPEDKIIDYIRTQFSNGLSIHALEIAVNQKFRASQFTSSKIDSLVSDLKGV